MYTTHRGALLQDAVYTKVLEGVQLPENVCQGSPVYQHCGKAEVDNGIENVIENASLGSDGCLGGENGVLLLNIDCKGDGNHMTPLYPDLTSSYERRKDSRHHSMAGNWECLVQRLGAGEPCVLIQHKSWNFDRDGLEREARFTVVRVRKINSVPNPVETEVVHVSSKSKRLIVSLEGRHPQNALDFVVVLNGVNPSVDGVYPLERLSGSNQFILRAPSECQCHGVLYDPEACGGDRPPPRMAFKYKLDSTKELYHVLPGDTSVLQNSRRCPEDNPQHEPQLSSFLQGTADNNGAGCPGYTVPSSSSTSPQFVNHGRDSEYHHTPEAFDQTHKVYPTTNSGALGSQLSSGGPTQFPSFSTRQSPGRSQEAFEKGTSESVNHIRGPQKPLSQANPMAPNLGAVNAPNSPLRDDYNVVKNTTGGNHQPATNTRQFLRQPEGDAVVSSAHFLNFAPKAFPRTVASAPERQQPASHKPVAPSWEQVPPDPPRKPFAKVDSMPFAEQNQNRGRTRNSEQGYTNSHTNQRMSESQDLHQSQRPEPVAGSVGRESLFKSGGAFVHHEGHPQFDPSTFASPIPQRAPDVLYSSSLMNRSGTGLTSMQDRSMANVSRNQPEGQTTLKPSVKNLVEVFHKVRLTRDDTVGLVQALMRCGWSNQLHQCLESFFQRLNSELNPATHHAPLTQGLNATGSRSQTLFNPLDHGANHEGEHPSTRSNERDFPQSTPAGVGDRYSPSLNHNEQMNAVGGSESGRQPPYTMADLGKRVAEHPPSQEHTHPTSGSNFVEPLATQAFAQNYADETNSQRVDVRNNQKGLNGQPSVPKSPCTSQQTVDVGPKGQIPGQELRRYQRDAIEKIMSSVGNFFVRAPTGSGKTRVFVECARRLLMSNQEARVVVLVPTQPLAAQQRKYFEDVGFSANGYRAATFVGGTPAKRDSMLKCSVLVMTVKILENKLNDGTLRFHDFQMLILDESHHTIGDSPYAKVMGHYRHQLNETRSAVKVIALSASPTRGDGLLSASKNFYQLLNDLCIPTENLINIEDDNEEIKDLVPRAEEEVVKIHPRDELVQFVEMMTSYLRKTLKIFNEFLKSKGLGSALSVPLPKVIKVGECYNGMKQWTQRVLSSIESCNIEASKTILDVQGDDLKASLGFISCVNSSLEQVDELGSEYVLKRVYGHIVNQNKATGALQGEQKATRLFYNLVFKYCNSAQVRMTDGTPLVNNAGPTTSSAGTLPRFSALESVLDRERFQSANFHGIIFVRTIEAVNELCRMLQCSPKVGNSIEFRALVGHGDTSKKDNSKKGMSGALQTEVLNWFRSDGRKALVATRAAEEGLNVASCELVVRYSVTLTGVERIQSRGRGRKHNALYVNILEKGSKEERQYQRSKAQEEAGSAVLSRLEN